MNVSEAFDVLAELCIALDAAPLTQFPGCWELQVDPQLWIAVNGHNETKQSSDGTNVEPFHCIVTYNGWPAGIINPFCGILATGECANEDTFIAAMRALIDDKRKGKP